MEHSVVTDVASAGRRPPLSCTHGADLPGDWKEVSRSHPCPICAHPHWCSFSTDGAWAICRRVDTGAGRHKLDRAGADYWVYALAAGAAARGEARAEPESGGAARADGTTLDRIYTALLASLRLSAAHREELRRRGLTLAEQEARGYRSLPVGERARLAGLMVERFGEAACRGVPGLWVREEDGRRWWSLAGAAGIVIPARDRVGRIIALKIRADEAGEEGRYTYVSSRRHCGPGPGAPVHVPRQAAALDTQRVRLTEGELKADVATALSGVLTLSVPGVSCWRAALPLLRDLGARTVCVAFDRDATRKLHVAGALARTVAAVSAAAFEVEVESWEEADGKGIDDLLAAGKSPTRHCGPAVAVEIERILASAGQSQTAPAAGESETPPASGGEEGAAMAGLYSLSSPFSPEGPERPRPQPLAEAAYYGIAGEVVAAIAPHTEAPRAPLLINFLAGIANLIGPEPHARVGATCHSLKINELVVGETATGCKGSGLSPIQQLMGRVDPDWARDCVKFGLTSGEGLIYHVRDPRSERQPVKQKGRSTGEYEEVVIDHGVADKRLFCIETEFAGVLKAMAREGSTLSPTIRQAWDGDTLQTLAKNSPSRASGAHIAISGHITPAELRRHLTETEAANGFANRFLFVHSERAQLLPEGGGTLDFEGLAARLQAIVPAARRLGLVARDRAARHVWAAVYPRLTTPPPGLTGALVSRAAAQTLRLSALYAALDGSPWIRVPHLLAALAIWDYCEASVRWLFGEQSGDYVADTLLACLRQSPAGLDRTEISHMLGRHVPAVRLSPALESLRQSGLARSQMRTDTGGRPEERWFALPGTVDPHRGAGHLAAARRAQAEFAAPEEGERSERSEESLATL